MQKKETLIIVDTSSVHRGASLKSGKKYAIKSYYYPSNLLDKYRKNFPKRLTKKLEN